MVGRFDIVVLNHDRLNLFVDGCSRIRELDPARDRITIVSASPSDDERTVASGLAERLGVNVRYLPRRNRGLAERGRAEYFTGVVGEWKNNLSYRFIWQMQDHYLAPDAPESLWGPELDYRHKSDVVPDGVEFNLDRMEVLADEHDLHGFVADRSGGCYMELGDERFMAPAGGNFLIRSDLVATPDAQEACRRLIRNCDNTYAWALYAEFKWGAIFFHEGRRFYDLARDRLLTQWRREELYVAPDDYRALMRRYEGPMAYRFAGWAQAKTGGVRGAVLNQIRRTRSISGGRRPAS